MILLFILNAGPDYGSKINYDFIRNILLTVFKVRYTLRFLSVAMIKVMIVVVF